MDFPTLVGIGTAIVSSLVAVGTLIFALKQDRDARILGFLKETDQEIARQLEKEETLRDYDECIVYAYNYLDIMQRIAFLYLHRRIPSSLANYYRTFFNYAETIMGWYTSVYDDKHPPEYSWPELIDWFAGQKMEPYHVQHLPKAMRDELEKKHVSNILEKVEACIQKRCFDKQPKRS